MSIDDYNLGLADGKESIMEKVCKMCGKALDAYVAIDGHGNMYHPECGKGWELEARTRSLEAESKMLLAQHQWERVKLVASMAVQIWAGRNKVMEPINYKACVEDACAMLKAAEKLCQETKT